MSIGYVRAVLQMRRPVGLHRLLLMVIAEHANKDTGIASPGNDLLSEETAISVRHIRRMIPELVAGGYIEIAQEGRGRGIVRQMRMLFEPAFAEPKEANQSPYRHVNGANQSPYLPEKGDKKGTEKGTNRAIKGDKLPEVEADNQLEPINHKPILVEDLDAYSAAQPSPSASVAAPPPQPLVLVDEIPANTQTVKEIKGDPNDPRIVTEDLRPAPPRPGSGQWTGNKHFDQRKVGQDGLIAKGQGSTPLEIWREWFTWMPTAAQMREMRETVTPDKLDLWRLVCEQTSLAGFKSYGNVIDIFAHGWKVGSKHAPANNGRIAGGNSGQGTQQPEPKPVSDWIFVPRAPDPNLPF